MALRYGFFDSEITGYDDEGMPEFDRAESSDFLAMFLSCLIRSGVMAVPGDCFQVMAGEGMTVQVRPGFGIIKGRFAYNDDPLPVTLPDADTSNKRIDRVILRANYPDRMCEVVVRSGVPNADPHPPDLLRDDNGDYFELCLALVAIRAGQTTVTQADITDTRADTAVCGWVTQNIDQVDTHTLFLQWQDAYEQFYADSSQEFDTWLGSLKDKLEGDAVGRILAEIDGLRKEKSDRPTVTGMTILASGWLGDVAPYINVLAVPDVKSGDIVSISLSDSATSDQFAAWSAGQFADGGQAHGQVRIRAYGKKPDVDLPVTMVITEAKEVS